MASEPYAEPTVPGSIPGTSGLGDISIEGRSPWYLAYRRLRRNKTALAFGALFLIILACCLAAPIWANDFAHTGPNDEHLNGSIVIDGHKTPVVAQVPGVLGTTLLGPGLHTKFLLGADENGRDVMVRLMYGGRTSIYVGLAAALVTTILAVIVALLAGYYRGWIDAVLSRTMDIIWAFPVLLLGIALGTTLSIGGLKAGPIQIAGDSLWIPILIIGLVYVPYVG